MIDWLGSALGDYNARVVVMAVSMLGAACGIVGTLLSLRKRALLGDAISHAALPGIAIAFLLGVWLSGGKSLPLLLAGGALGGLAGVGAMLLLKRLSPLREDAILATVLSVFFGAGVVLLSVIQSLSTGHAAGLDSFIYGRTAAIVASDAWLMMATACGVVIIAVTLAKEWRVLCFDEAFAQSIGLRVGVLDAALMALATIVTVVGMQAVGLILVVALQVIPAAAARFWSHRLSLCIAIAALLGALSGAIGALVSAAAPDLPSGAMIVLAAAALFAFSMAFGSARGMVWRGLAHWRGARRVAVEHLLRALYEEDETAPHAGASRVAISARRRFLPGALTGAVHRSRRLGWVREDADRSLHLTSAGRIEAERLTARHRLWELFLIERAGVSPTHVDRDADLVEHVLSPELLARVERSLGELRGRAQSHAKGHAKGHSQGLIHGAAATLPSPHSLDRDDRSVPRESS